MLCNGYVSRFHIVFLTEQMKGSMDTFQIFYVFFILSRCSSHMRLQSAYFFASHSKD